MRSKTIRWTSTETYRTYRICPRRLTQKGRDGYCNNILVIGRISSHRSYHLRQLHDAEASVVRLNLKSTNMLVSLFRDLLTDTALMVNAPLVLRCIACMSPTTTCLNNSVLCTAEQYGNKRVGRPRVRFERYTSLRIPFPLKRSFKVD